MRCDDNGLQDDKRKLKRIRFIGEGLLVLNISALLVDRGS